jgi:hypothetical protein
MTAKRRKVSRTIFHPDTMPTTRLEPYQRHAKLMDDSNRNLIIQIDRKTPTIFTRSSHGHHVKPMTSLYPSDIGSLANASSLHRTVGRVDYQINVR